MAEYILNMLTDYWFWGSVGFTLGFVLMVRNVVRNGCSFPVAVAGVTAGLYGGLLGTRLLWILIFSPWLLWDNPLLAMAFWQQTGTWLGAAPGGSIGFAIVLCISKKPFWSNLGSTAPGLALAHIVARVGCLCAGCCHGAPASVPWAIYSKKLNAMVHPTQVYSMLGEAVSLVILQLLWRKAEYRKYLYPGYAMLLATHRFINGFFRGDYPGPEIIAGLRVYQSLCVYLFALGLVAIVILRWKWRGLIAAAAVVGVTVWLTVWLRPVAEEELAAQRQGTKLYLAATRECFAGQLGRWEAERSKEGFKVVVGRWPAAPSAQQVKDWLREQSESYGGLCSYILIVGDCASEKDGLPRWHMPSNTCSVEHNGRMVKFASDALYGDMDDDGCPDVPVGRLTVQDDAELDAQISKIITYKYHKPRPDWFRTVVWAGSEGYTSEIRNITMSVVDLLPKWVDRFVICADPCSAYAGDVEQQPGLFLEQMNEPAFLSAIVSHGSFRSVTPMVYRGREVFLCVEDVAALSSQQPSGLLVLLSCDSGMFDMPLSVGPSLTEAFSAHRGGPVGVFAASQSPHPLTKYFVTAAMMHQIEARSERIGDFVLGTVRELYRRGGRSLVELAQDDKLARSLLGALSGGQQESLLRSDFARNEVLMFNLIGDPACRMKLPREMPVSVKRDTEGQMVASGQTPTKCSELFVQWVRGDDGGDSVRADYSQEARERRFREVNRCPRMLLMERLNGKSWEVKFSLPVEYTVGRDYLRFIAAGSVHSYAAVWALRVQR